MRSTHRLTVAAFTLLGLLVMPVASTSAQAHHTAAKPAAKPMSNGEVIALASAGLGDDVIMAKIHAAPTTDFDTSVAGLSALKSGGVSSAVIRYMIDPSAAPAAAAPAAVSQPAPVSVAAAPIDNPDDPMSPHSPGVYILTSGNDGKQHLVKLDHITAKKNKTGGMWASGMTYGIVKAHTKVDIDGIAATVHTHDNSPTFYAYIPEDTNTFGGNSISVRDLTLIKFDVKASERELTTGSFSEWGSKSGADDKAKQGLDPEQLKAGVYKLTLNQPLQPGQYAFQHQNYGAFFDFGITPAE